jgi:hypothetical protein
MILTSLVVASQKTDIAFSPLVIVSNFRKLARPGTGDIATHAPTTPERLATLRLLSRGFERRFIVHCGQEDTAFDALRPYNTILTIVAGISQEEGP